MEVGKMEIDSLDRTIILKWTTFIYKYMRSEGVDVVWTEEELDLIERIDNYYEYEVVNVELKKMSKIKKIYYILKGRELPQEEFE